MHAVHGSTSLPGAQCRRIAGQKMIRHFLCKWSVHGLTQLSVFEELWSILQTGQSSPGHSIGHKNVQHSANLCICIGTQQIYGWKRTFYYMYEFTATLLWPKLWDVSRVLTLCQSLDTWNSLVLLFGAITLYMAVLTWWCGSEKMDPYQTLWSVCSQLLEVFLRRLPGLCKHMLSCMAWHEHMMMKSMASALVQTHNSVGKNMCSALGVTTCNCMQIIYSGVVTPVPSVAHDSWAPTGTVNLYLRDLAFEEDQRADTVGEGAVQTRGPQREVIYHECTHNNVRGSTWQSDCGLIACLPPNTQCVLSHR